MLETAIEMDRAQLRLRPGITACIAAHPARLTNGLLERALRSVLAQTLQPAAIIVGNDIERRSAGVNRQNILDMVQTEWMAWLDSDDEWYPEHLAKLHAVAEQTGAMFVFSWYDAPGEPLGHFGLPFNPETPHHTTTTFLVKTEHAKACGFGEDIRTESHSNEDWLHLLRLCERSKVSGEPMVHLAERTWYWHMDEHNSCGLPGLGDAT